MRFLQSINEYFNPPTLDTAPVKRRNVNSSPTNVSNILMKIVDRYNKLISKENTSESLEDNLGISQEYLDRLKSEFPEADISGAQSDSTDIVRILAAIRESESQMSDSEKKEKAMEIVDSIFSGRGFDISKIKFNLHIVNDEDLMEIKNKIIGKTPDEFKEIKAEIKDENPKLAKEIDIRSIQNALTQGFSSAVKDDFIMGDSEIQGVSFGEYYDMMNKMFNMYSKIPSELIHQVLTSSSAVGKVELQWNEDTNKYEIDAHGYTILILVHEMVKGIYELISFNRDPKLSDDDDKKMMDMSGTQYMEREGLQYGPGLVNTFKDFFKKVEDGLLDSRQIDSRNPSVMANILARLYKLEDDLFLRICKSIFTDDESVDKPYHLFEEYYMDAIEGRGFSRGSDDSDEPDTPDSPQAPSDSAIGDLLRNAGISLNMDPTYENLKYVSNFELFSLLEGYKEQLETYTQQGVDVSTIATYIQNFKQLTQGIYDNVPDGTFNTKGKANRKKVPNDRYKALMNAPIISNVDQDINDRINIEKYKDFSTLKVLVDYVRRNHMTKPATHLQVGDINPAILQIKKILNLEESPYYDDALSTKIKEFQKEFIEKHSNVSSEDINMAIERYKEVGFNKLEVGDKVVLGSSLKFISDTTDILKDLEKNLGVTRDTFSNSRDKDERKDLALDIKSQSSKIEDLARELKDIRSIFSGGLSNPSGKLDIPTSTAFAYDKGLTRLEGIGNLGTLKPSGGSIVYKNNDVRIYRNESKRFCIDTRKDFEKILVELGSTGQAYNWCTSWESHSYYSSHRNSAQNVKQTIYFIENIKRSEYEMSKWKEFSRRDGVDMSSVSGTADSDSTTKQYLKWRVDNDRTISESDASEILNDPARRFYDNYHIAVVFVNTRKLANGENSYWVVGASNDGHWGNEKHLSFEKIAKTIWPENANDSKRIGGKSSDYPKVYQNIQVPQEIINQPWYSRSAIDEIDKFKKSIMIPTELSSIERGTDTNRSQVIKSPDASTFKSWPYEDKEEWLLKYWTSEDSISSFLKNRNINAMPLKYWQELPKTLKKTYIVQTFSQLTPEMYDVIKDDAQLKGIYAEFVKRRTLGDSGSGGLIHSQIVWDPTISNFSKNIETIKNNLLSEIDINILSTSLDIPKLEEEILKLNDEINSEKAQGYKQSKWKNLVLERDSKNSKLKNHINASKKYQVKLLKVKEDMTRWLSEPANVRHAQDPKVKELNDMIDRSIDMLIINSFANNTSTSPISKDNDKISLDYINGVKHVLRSAFKDSGKKYKNIQQALHVLNKSDKLSDSDKEELKAAEDKIYKPFDGKTLDGWIDDNLSDGDYEMHTDDYTGHGKTMSKIQDLMDMAKDDVSWNRIIDKYFAKLILSNPTYGTFKKDQSVYTKQLLNAFKFVEDLKNPKWANRMMQFIEKSYAFKKSYGKATLKNKIKMKDSYNKLVDGYSKTSNDYFGKDKKWRKLLGDISPTEEDKPRRTGDTEILG